MSDAPERQELILRRYLTNLHLEDGYWHGYLNSDNDLQLFERYLAARNEKYSVRTSREFDAAPKPRFVFSMIHRGHKISLDIPFRVTKEMTKVCIFGEEFWKSDNPGPAATGRAKETFEKKRQKVQVTKKKGCQATLNLKWVELFPGFKVDIPQPCGRIKEQNIKSSMIEDLQKATEATETITSEKRIYVCIATSTSHSNHGFSDTEGFSQRMDKSLVERIPSLVREGITSVSDIKKCLHYYVHDVLFPTDEKPDSSSRAFFPTSKDIRNHVQACLIRDQSNTVDQTNTLNLLEKVQSEQPESSVVSQPYAASRSTGYSTSDDMEENVAS